MLRFKARRLDPTQRETLTPSQRRFQQRIIRMWGDVRDLVTSNQDDIAYAVLHRGAIQVEAMIPMEPLIDAQDFFYRELLTEVLDGGSRVKLPAIEKARVAFSFDRSRPEAANWASRNAGEMINNFNKAQREALRDLIARAEMGDFTVDSVARQLRNSIGLTEQQAGWVENRWEREFTTRIANGFSLRDAEALADQASNRYYQQVLRYRSETIARTEILKASHEGRREAWQQGIEGGWIDPSWQQEWIASSDACEICLPFNGTRVAVNARFPAGEPPLHPNCRCDVMLVESMPRDPSFAALSDDQLDALITSLAGDL